MVSVTNSASDVSVNNLNEISIEKDTNRFLAENGTFKAFIDTGSLSIVYTVPSGKKFILTSFAMPYNSTQPKVVVQDSASDYILYMAGGASQPAVFGNCFMILEAGDKISLAEWATAQGFEIDDTLI